MFAPGTHEMGSGSPESLRSLKIQWLVPSPVLLDAGQGLLLSCSPPPPGQHLGGSTAAPHPRGFQRQVGWGGSTAAPTPGGSDGRWAGEAPLLPPPPGVPTAGGLGRSFPLSPKMKLRDGVTYLHADFRDVGMIP